MSLHTGEPVVGEEGYVGIDIHRAARICAAGHGGQVLLSATTAALVSGTMPDGVSKRDLGEVRLKDIDAPEHVTQLVIEGLPASFPPLRVAQEEPMDFGERLAQRIKADVERQVEASLAGASVSSVPYDRPRARGAGDPRARRGRGRGDRAAGQARLLSPAGVRLHSDTRSARATKSSSASVNAGESCGL